MNAQLFLRFCQSACGIMQSWPRQFNMNLRPREYVVRLSFFYVHVCTCTQVIRKRAGASCAVTVQPAVLMLFENVVLHPTWTGICVFALRVLRLKMGPKHPYQSAETPRWVELGINRPPEPIVALMHVKCIVITVIFQPNAWAHTQKNIYIHII